MKKTLRPFQLAGRDHLVRNHHALLADEPGLGKTVQAIAAAELLAAKRILVIAPASMRLGWRQEIEECLGAQEFMAGWHIISYNEAVKWAPKSMGLYAYDLCILDEAHFLKTPDSQRTQAVFGNAAGLARRAARVWALSGTPVLNRPIEFYPLLKCLAARAIAPYDTFTRFAQHFCGAYFDGHGLNVKGASHLDDLASRLQGFMLRRTKEEVLPELPPRIVTRVPVEISAADRRAIDAAESAIGDREAFISSTRENFSQLGDMSTLLRVTGEAKVAAAARYVEDLLETERKIVVFARHRSVIAELTIQIEGGCVVYQGGMSDREKQEAVNRFVKDPNCRVFIGNIQAAGTGINGLQEVCQTAVFAELSWTPGEMSQAADRLHRMGQRGSSVNIHWLYAPNTLEAAVLGVHDAKNSVIDRLMSGGAAVEGLL